MVDAFFKPLRRVRSGWLLALCSAPILPSATLYANNRQTNLLKPQLSLILVVFDMPDQAEKTLQSLSQTYQRNVEPEDYEVIVVEHASPRVLGAERATQFPGNFRYFLREESLPSPVPGVLFGVNEAAGDLLAIMVDGARMASPGLIAQMITASGRDTRAVVSVPGYHIGNMVQQEALKQGYDEAEEHRLLRQIKWPEDGYRLFNISVFSGSCKAGFLKPNAESNCLCMHRDIWKETGGIDPRFTETGGGQANPDLYKRVCEHPDIRLIVIPGEGTFHQFHGGVTTGRPAVEREVHMQNHFEQYKELRGEYYRAPQTEPELSGHIPQPALRFLHQSIITAGFKPDPSDPGKAAQARPTLSLIVIGYDMALQLENTLTSLSSTYQQGVTPADYEVIVVENASHNVLCPKLVKSLPPNFSYHLRQEQGHSPVPAINFAFDRCRGDFIGLIMDGARMLSPGALRGALDAWTLDQNALVVVPGYHIGQQEQHEITSPEVALSQEQQLLSSIDWSHHGYDLFTIATFSGANRHGYLHPIMECNCVFASSRNFKRIGYANPDFTLPGGGSINLHMYRSLGMLGDTNVYVLPGEGSFHQYHGGVTTSSYADRDAEIERHRVQLHSYWPGGFHSLRREPTLLGKVSPQALPFLQESLARSANRTRKLAERALPLWPDEPTSSQQD